MCSFPWLSPWLETPVMAGTLSAPPSPPRASVISGMYLLGSAVLPSVAPSSHISWLRLLGSSVRTGLCWALQAAMSSKRKALAQIGHQAHLRWKHDPQLLLGGVGRGLCRSHWLWADHSDVVWHSKPWAGLALGVSLTQGRV